MTHTQAGAVFEVQQDASNVTLTLRIRRELSDNVVDISSATTHDFIFKKPDGTTFTRSAVLVGGGSTGRMRYALGVGELDQAGVWLLQGDLVMNSYTGRTSVIEFNVNPNL